MPHHFVAQLLTFLLVVFVTPLGAQSSSGSGAGIRLLVDGNLAPDGRLIGFAPVSVLGSSPVEVALTIESTGTAALEISAGGIVFGGSNMGEFSLTGASLPLSLAPGETADFLVRFDPVASGVRSATMQINSNASDSDDASWDLALEGIGSKVMAAVTLEGNAAARWLTAATTSPPPATPPAIHSPLPTPTRPPHSSPYVEFSIDMATWSRAVDGENGVTITRIDEGIATGTDQGKVRIETGGTRTFGRLSIDL